MVNNTMSKYMYRQEAMPITVTETVGRGNGLPDETIKFTEQLIFQLSFVKGKEVVNSSNPDDRIEFLITKNNSSCDCFTLRVNANKYTEKSCSQNSIAFIWCKKYINLAHASDWDDIFTFFKLCCEDDYIKCMRYFRFQKN